MATASERAPHAWTCRPSLFVSRMLGFSLAMLIALIAVFLLFQEGQVLWPVLAVPVSIWVGFKGGPLLLRLLERAGLFGRVRIQDGRLLIGRASNAIQLGEPFEVDARVQHATIVREYDTRQLGLTQSRNTRKHTVRVKVLSVLIGQAGKRYQLVADETDRDTSSEYETDGLAVRPLPVVNVPGTKARLWGVDLVGVLGQLREATGYSTPAVGEQPKALEDPRKAFCPTWKVAVGAVSIVCVFVVGSLAAYQGYAERQDAAWAELEADAKRQHQEAEAAARPLVGRRVVIDAAHGARIVGTVESYRLIDSLALSREYESSHAEVAFLVEELIDEDGQVLPEGATLSHRFTMEPVSRGDRLEHRADDVELWADTRAEDPQ